MSLRQDVFYHFIALLFYFAAFVLEAATTAASKNAITVQTAQTTCTCSPLGNVFTVLTGRRYGVNVAATIFTCIVTLCYGCSMVMGFKRWRK